MSDTTAVSAISNQQAVFSLPTQKLPAHGLDIWWVPLPEMDVTNLLTAHADCLSALDQQRLQLRRLPKGQFQFVFTRIVLRHLLSSYHSSISPSEWQINKSASGRPHLSPDQTPLSFNLTHTDDCLIIAFSQYADPGVDVELLSRPVDIEIVAKRYFSTEEYRLLQRQKGDEQVELFFRFWTLKEAAVKASGLGLAKAMRQFEFSAPAGELFQHASQSGDFNFWSTCYAGHVAAVALMHRQNSRQQNIMPISRQLCWPGVVTHIDPVWAESQSKNSSTNLEP